MSGGGAEVLTTAALMRLADRSMPGMERVNFRDWIVRSALGCTGRANSTLANGDPGLGIEEAIRAVESWYRERGRGAIFQIFESADDLGPVLSAQGYAASEPTVVMCAPLESVRTGEAERAVVHCDIPPGLHSLVGEPDRVTEITTTTLDKLVAVVSGDDGCALGCGMAVIDGTAAGIFAMRTATDAQGQGVGTIVLAALVTNAREQGVRDLWLQVEHSNIRAREWYERIGFLEVDAYRYWHPPIPSFR